MQPQEILKRKKSKKDTHPSSLMSLQRLFNSTQAGRIYLEVLRKPLSLSKGERMQQQANR